MRTLAIALVISLFCAGASEAQMLGELRGGVFVHNLGNGMLDSCRIADANVEFLFKPLLDTYVAGSLNPHIGVTANFGGAESFGYAGLTYHLPIAVTPFFVEAGLGAALGSDAITGSSNSKPAQAQQVGCAVMGHAEGSVGMNVAGLADVMLTAENYFPVSSCGNQSSITNIGARVGFSF